MHETDENVRRRERENVCVRAGVYGTTKSKNKNKKNKNGYSRLPESLAKLLYNNSTHLSLVLSPVTPFVSTPSVFVSLFACGSDGEPMVGDAAEAEAVAAAVEVDVRGLRDGFRAGLGEGCQ
jgi:hypothetical protein